MASGSRNSRRRGSTARSLPRLSPETRCKLVGILLLLVGAATFLSLLFPHGTATSAVSRLTLIAGGWGAMAIPVVLLWMGGALLRCGLDPAFTLQGRQWAGAGLLLVSFFGLLHLLPFGDSDPLVRAGRFQGGGYLGLPAFAVLQPNLGALGSSLLLMAGVLVGAGLVASVQPRQALLFLRDGWQRLGRWRAERSRAVVINPASEPPSPRLPAPTRRAQPPASDVQEAVARDDEAEGPVAAGGPRREWVLPPIDVFTPAPEVELSQVDIRQRIRVIEDTLRSFGVEARVVEVNQGPAVTQFGVEPGVGVKVARIMALANDLALRLAAAPLRLEAPVPGKQVVGIEVPNGTVSVVSMRDLLESQAFRKHRGRLRLALGRDVSGAPAVADLAKMPHLLIAGATGSGKSVCLNSFIAALLHQCVPTDLRMLMIDPKMVELVPFNGIPHLLTPVVTDMEKVVPSLKWVTKEMERRYRLFAARGSRNIETYNRATSGRGEDVPLSYLVVIVDELADLMMTAPDEVEKILCRLAQLARATGIHLVVATQRPSVDVVTGLIKANFPTRIAFAVTSQIDSRVILDQSGAEKLLGRGDMLYLPTDAIKPIRLQGTYVSDGELGDLVDHWKRAAPPSSAREVEGGSAFQLVEDEDSDDLYEQAVELVSQHSRVSTSLLQRRLRIGYNRAARLIDLLEKEGVVGSSENGKSREVLIRSEAADEETSPE